MKFIRNVTLLLSVVLAVATVWGQDRPRADSGPSHQLAAKASDARWRDWANRLGSDKFQEREEATRALTAAGAPAIPAVIEAACHRDAETRLRATSILSKLSRSADMHTANKARLAVRIISDSPDRANALRTYHSLTKDGDIEDLGRFIEERWRSNSGKITLRLTGTNAADEHFRQLASPSFKVVETLEADGTKVTDAGLVHLKGLTLIGLNLHSTKISDAGLAHLRDLPLKSLSLGGTQVTDAGIQQLKGLPLESLMLANTHITDAGLAHLGELPLRSLNLSGTRITGDGLQYLRELHLESLSVSGKQINDEGLKQLRRMPMKSLHLGDTSITDTGLAHLVDMPLERLWLYDTAVTDRGLAHLEKIKTLETLYVQHTQVTEKAAGKLRQTVQQVHTGRGTPRNIKRVKLMVRISRQDITRAETREFTDAFAVTNRIMTDLIRSQAKAKCAELGHDPNNIGLPNYSSDVQRFQRDGDGVKGYMTFDFYEKRSP